MSLSFVLSLHCPFHSSTYVDKWASTRVRNVLTGHRAAALSNLLYSHPGETLFLSQDSVKERWRNCPAAAFVCFLLLLLLLLFLVLLLLLLFLLFSVCFFIHHAFTMAAQLKRKV